MPITRFPFLALVILPILTSTSCTDDSAPSSPQRGVIQGTIDSDGYPQVFFSASIDPADEGSISDAVINWGKVTVSDGEREVVLTGRVDSDRLPPFRYYSFDMKGKPGKTYTVRADYLDIHLESTCTMQVPVPIDSLSFTLADSPSQRATTLFLTSPEDVPAYFYITLSKADASAILAPPGFMGTLCADRPRSRYSIPVLRPRQKIDTATYVAQLMVGEEWTIGLHRIDKAVYDFWVAYDNMLLTSNSPFLSSDVNLPTNVRGGFGVWSAQGSTYRSFRVE